MVVHAHNSMINVCAGQTNWNATDSRVDVGGAQSMGPTPHYDVATGVLDYGDGNACRVCILSLADSLSYARHWSTGV